MASLLNNANILHGVNSWHPTETHNSWTLYLDLVSRGVHTLWVNCALGSFWVNELKKRYQLKSIPPATSTDICPSDRTTAVVCSSARGQKISHLLCTTFDCACHMARHRAITHVNLLIISISISGSFLSNVECSINGDTFLFILLVKVSLGLLFG